MLTGRWGNWRSRQWRRRRRVCSELLRSAHSCSQSLPGVTRQQEPELAKFWLSCSCWGVVELLKPLLLPSSCSAAYRSLWGAHRSSLTVTYSLASVKCPPIARQGSTTPSCVLYFHNHLTTRPAVTSSSLVLGKG